MPREFTGDHLRDTGGEKSPRARSAEIVKQAPRRLRLFRGRRPRLLELLCLAKTKSGYEINNLHRRSVTCYMDEDRLVRSLAKNNPALSRFLDIIAPSDTMKREPDPLMEA